ncbi:MAG TPA: penicillin-binding transpeptidase domain-containing protein [Gaiellaceae bacterium]|nr:penicillin-binding transpeptidase domain-containing protein [Gaiellaceae bacterium]
MRIGGLAALVGAAICLLLLRAWSIQILHGPGYTSQANEQSFRTVDLIGPRGPIVDSKGRLLAGTTGHLVVAADVAALGTIGAHGTWTPSARGTRALTNLSKLAHVPVATLLERIRRSVVRSPFAPAVVLPHPDGGLAFYVAERTTAYRDFKVTPLVTRSYPQGGLGSEFLGLLGEVSKPELGSPRYVHANAGEIVGQSGVEAVYDSLLNPGFVHARLRVDSSGRIAGPLEVPAGKPLPTLQLTINAQLQRATVAAVEHGIALSRKLGYHPTGGSAVVMSPRTGGIYALASVPTYNQVEAAKDPTYLQHLYTDPQDLLVDRAIAGVYPTGSTFKPIVAEAGLSLGVITPSTPLLCSGSFNLGNFVFHNVEAGIFENMSLPTALAQSCDTWFYRLGDRIYSSDPSRQGTAIQQWARALGLGQRTGIDLTGDAAGLVPTPAWLQRTKHSPWYEGQTINLAIGQGYLQASPLQMAVMYAALANGGTIVRPHVADAVVRGSAVRKLSFPPVRHVKLVDVDAIRQGLYEAAHTGTSASVFANFPVPVAGKTGTAEAPPGDDHSWYASWAPAGSHPEVVVVVMIEHGGFGAEAAAPAARDIYKAFFHLKH